MRDKKQFVEFWERNNLYWKKDSLKPYKKVTFFVSLYRKFAEVFGRENSYYFHHTNQPFDFKIDSEDLDILYEKYKPLVEKWECGETEREIERKKKRIKEEQEALRRLESKKC